MKPVVDCKPIALRPRWWVVVIVRVVLSLYLPRAYNVKVAAHPSILKRKGPFILVGNHQNFWDPFFASLPLSAVPQFVTSDNIFRGGLFARVMKGLGSIPISKYMRNIDAIRSIRGVLARNGVVGIYPEADRNYDGVSLPIREGVAKLISIMNVPVIAVRQKGGFLSGPKWGPHRRRGIVELTYTCLYEPDREGKLDSSALRCRIEEAIRHDEMLWQKKAMIPFANAKRAEFIERFLFLCPRCDSLQSLSSARHVITCSRCAAVTEMDEFGFLRPVNWSGARDWSLFSTWNTYQTERLAAKLHAAGETAKVFSQPIRLSTGFRSTRLTDTGPGNAVCLKSGIGVETAETTTFFPFGEIQGATVQNDEQFEFYHANSLYRFTRQDRSASGHLWFTACTVAQRNL